MRNYSDLKVVITGATRGIGFSILQSYLELNAKVIGIGSSQNSINEANEKLSLKQKCEWLVADFSNRSSTEEVAQQLVNFGPDVLVNNAGINKTDTIDEISTEDWYRIQEVNLHAPFVLCKTLTTGMKERRKGWIINITSIFGHVSKAKRASYSTSKFGLLGLTKAMALDLAPYNVLVNAIAPGFIDTELTRQILTNQQISELVQNVPLGRLGDPNEIAKVVCFLGSPENTFITGQNIIADGGFTVA